LMIIAEQNSVGQPIIEELVRANLPVHTFGVSVSCILCKFWNRLPCIFRLVCAEVSVESLLGFRARIPL
jgi:hypothetical protein